jgi:poly(3-hydroxybutyrate) depolymerase
MRSMKSSGWRRGARWLPALAAACLVSSAAAARAEWQAQTAGGVSVEVYTPASQSPIGQGRALLVVLHGCTQSAATLRDQGNLRVAGDDFGAVVAVPTVPNGGVLAGCWDYYGPSHARTGRHDGPLLEMTAALLADPALGIDPAQVYIAGLSSGAGQAMVMGCVAPDVFAGVGIAAGPTVGTESSQIAIVSTHQAAAATLCRTLAGGASPSFDTQLAAVIAGSSDYIVAQGYADLNAAVMGDVYSGGSALASSALDVSSLEGYQPAGEGQLLSDATGPRISLIHATGMGHAWPAGSGEGFELSFVAKEGVSWGQYLARFFSENSRRALGASSSAGSGGGGGSAPGAGGASSGGEPAAGAGAQGSSDDGGCSVAAPSPQRSGLPDWAAALLACVAMAAARRARHRAGPAPACGRVVSSRACPITTPCPLRMR